MFDLSGRVALVTGGSRGLGRAMAEALGRAGADLALCGRTASDLEAAAEALGAATGRRVFALPADVTRPEDVDRLAEAVLGEYGRIDILVNNVGAGIRKPLLEIALDEWQRSLAVNLTSAFLCARRFVPGMLARGWGRVINIASALGSIALPERGPYCAAKGGLIQLTRVMALEWARQGVTVNAICPGPFKTPYNLLLQQHPQLYESYLNLIPQHRWGELDEIGGAVVFLASDEASFITGSALYVDGGWTAHGGLPEPGAAHLGDRPRE